MEQYNLPDKTTDINVEVEDSPLIVPDNSGSVDISKPDSDEINEKLLRLPISRVKKLMKTDPDVCLASREAVFLITKATVYTLFYLLCCIFVFVRIELYIRCIRLRVILS